MQHDQKRNFRYSKIQKFAEKEFTEFIMLLTLIITLLHWKQMSMPDKQSDVIEK